MARCDLTAKRDFLTVLFCAAALWFGLPIFSAELENGDFSRWEKGVPVGWTRHNAETEMSPAPDGGAALRVHQISTDPVMLSQRIALDRPDQRFTLTGRIRAESAYTAFVDVTLFCGERELRRFCTIPYIQLDERFRIVFDTRDADALEVRCCMISDGFLGDGAVFSSLKLEPFDQPLGCWTAKTPFAYLTPEDDGFRALTMGCLDFALNAAGLFRANNRMEFAATVDAGFIDFSRLSAELYKDGELLETVDGEWNRWATERQRVVFDTKDADRIILHCQFANQSLFHGGPVRLSGASFTALDAEPSPEPDPDRALSVEPGYMVASVYLSNVRADSKEAFHSKLSYREKGSDVWLDAFEPVYAPFRRTAAGSVVNLKENTDYELRLDYSDSGEDAQKEGCLSATFTTRTADVPIAETVTLGPGRYAAPLMIQKSGSPDGYIRYIAEPGFTLDAGNEAAAAVVLDGVSYVILDGLTIRGGKCDSVRILNSSHIQVKNCDIADFGRAGVPLIERDGKLSMPGSTRPLDHDCGILLLHSDHALIERCFIHDTRGTANSWFYSHPSGPNAVYVGDAAQATIRYNDFIGSDAHRWNDAVEGWKNADLTGSVYRDAEICGNFFGFGNDDGMELDGGQMNCRFFGNRTEGQLCGVSTAPAKYGPSYLWRNLFCNPGDEFDIFAYGFKNGSGIIGLGEIFYFNNTISGPQIAFSRPGGKPKQIEDVKKWNVVKAFGRNNIALTCALVDQQYLTEKLADFDYDLFGYPGIDDRFAELRSYGQEKNGQASDPKFLDAARGLFFPADDSPAVGAGERIPNFAPLERPNLGAMERGKVDAIPIRPIPYTTSVSMVTLDYSGGDADETQTSVVIQSENPNYAANFSIRQPESAPFFTVEPAAGRIEPGKPVTLTVRVNPNGVTQPRRNTCAFVIKTDDGFSRPVSVAVDSTRHPTLLARERAGAVYGTVTPEANGDATLTFDLPRAGAYWLFAQTGEGTYNNDAYTKGIWVARSIDQGPNEESLTHTIRVRERAWCSVSSNVYSGRPNRPIHLCAGRHTIRLIAAEGDRVNVTDAVMTENADGFRLSPGTPR